MGIVSKNPEKDIFEDTVEVLLANEEVIEITFVYRRYKRDVGLANALRGLPYPIKDIRTTREGCFVPNYTRIF